MDCRLSLWEQLLEPHFSSGLLREPQPSLVSEPCSPVQVWKLVNEEAWLLLLAPEESLSCLPSLLDGLI